MSTPSNQVPNIPEEYLSYTVIHNYSPNSELELKDALNQNYDVILLSDITLGKRVCNWVQLGNILHKFGVISGVSSLLLNIATQTADWLTGCISVCSIISITIYNTVWRPDIMSCYQLDTRGDFVAQMPLSSVKSQSLMVLVKQDDKYRRFLHNLIGCFLLIQFGLKLRN
ncbi:Transmembrane protein 11, mitochondrial [Oopsacas minuta]|uniref:Transmembrane protein 11, mitochondrial n=1 Tax=Oopsacas minuta TaxID=111878 RepID=A0AAV7K595_9METZ|nr:Transmembrane protein 11, mitochondrial [Oopsacas minuta]